MGGCCDWHGRSLPQSSPPVLLTFLSPHEEMAAFLSAPGLHHITMMNTWYSYGSLQHLLASSSAVLKDAAVSDGGMR